MDAEDFKTCLISIGYNLVKPRVVVTYAKSLMCVFIVRLCHKTAATGSFDITVTLTKTLTPYI